MPVGYIPAVDSGDSAGGFVQAVDGYGVLPLTNTAESGALTTGYGVMPQITVAEGTYDLAVSFPPPTLDAGAFGIGISAPPLAIEAANHADAYADLVTPALTLGATGGCSASVAAPALAVVAAASAGAISVRATATPPVVDAGSLSNSGLVAPAPAVLTSLAHKIYAEVAAPYCYLASVGLGSSYSICAKVASAVALAYDLEAVSFLRVVSSVQAPYNEGRISSDVSIAYPMPDSIKVLQSIASVYSCRGLVRSPFSSLYSMPDKVRNAVSAPSSIKSYNRVVGAFAGIYSALSASQVISTSQQPYITVGGVDVAIESGDVSTSEGGFAWECNLVVAKVEDYARFQRDTPFTVTLYGEVYQFITDGKEIQRGSPAEVSCRIMGISPSASFASPRSPAKDYLWATVKYASAIVQEATSNGVTWGIVDWPLPAHRVSFTRATPMDIVKKLAEVAGGVVETSRAGALRVRSLFPISVPLYPSATPSHVFLEVTDILSVSENYAYDEVYNKYRLLDVETAAEDTLEWEQGTSSPYVGIIRAYPFPWRTDAVLKHTGDPAITIGAQVYSEKEYEETVEFFEGVGSTAHPILSISSVRWTAVNLGALTYATDSRELTVSGPQQNSVAIINYKSRSLEYPVVAPNSDPAQFLLESTVL